MVAMASTEVLKYSKFFPAVCDFSVLLLEWNQGLSVAIGALLLSPEHKASEGHVWIYLQNPICNRLTVEYLYTEHVRNSGKISLRLTLEFTFSLIWSILKSQSIMCRYLLPEDYTDCPLSWASLYHNPCATGWTSNTPDSSESSFRQTAMSHLSLYFHCRVSACIIVRENMPMGLINPRFKFKRDNKLMRKASKIIFCVIT